MGRRDYRKVTQRKPKTKGKGDELIDWTIQDLRDRWARTSKGALKFKDQLLYGMDSTPSEVSQPKRRRITDIPSQEERWRIEEEEVQKALGQDAQGKTVDPVKQQYDAAVDMFRHNMEANIFSDQQLRSFAKNFYDFQTTFDSKKYFDTEDYNYVANTADMAKYAEELDKKNYFETETTSPVVTESPAEVAKEEGDKKATSSQNIKDKTDVVDNESEGKTILQKQGEVLNEPLKTAADDRRARRDRRLEDKKAEGRPLERLRLEKARDEGLGKLINDEFEKNRV